MKEYGMQLFDAHNFVQNQRNIIFPNPYFMKELIKYEYELFSTNSFAPFIDDFTVNHIMTGLKFQKDLAVKIKQEYIYHNRDIIKTLRCITGPIRYDMQESNPSQQYANQ
jgi:hypothetical protein